MLSIGKIALGQHRYYERQVAGGGDDYYSVGARLPESGWGPGQRRSGSQGV